MVIQNSGDIKLVLLLLPIDCGACEKVCCMQISPGSFRGIGIVQHGDCLKCSNFVEICPKQALDFF
jgi:NAD-dependent dihydropyrimidine dehydrogenase PreA subunit